MLATDTTLANNWSAGRLIVAPIKGDTADVTQNYNTDPNAFDVLCDVIVEVLDIPLEDLRPETEFWQIAGDECDADEVCQQTAMRLGVEAEDLWDMHDLAHLPEVGTFTMASLQELAAFSQTAERIRAQHTVFQAPPNLYSVGRVLQRADM